MGLFAMLEDDEPAASIPIPKLAEMKRADLMAMEKETTGLYLSGHPMDDYRALLKNTHVVPIGDLMDEESRFRDDQIVSVAGIVQSVKMKTTRNNSMMAYVTVEDDTAAIEMLGFSNVLSQYGGYLKENAPVVITGRLSIRDEKEPQIVINRARPISDFENMAEEPAQEFQPQPVGVNRREWITGRLYLSVPAAGTPLLRKVRAILQMFPGGCPVGLKDQDTRQTEMIQGGITLAMLEELTAVLGTGKVFLFLPKTTPLPMLDALRTVLGSENVVLK